MTGLVKQNYRDCFGFSMQNEDNRHSPSFICYNCYKRLRDLKKRPRSKFAVPALWRQPSDHSTDCYFCLTKTYGFNRKNKKNIKYPDVTSVSKPVLLSRLLQEDQDVDMNADVSSLEDNSLNTTSSMELKPSLFTQEELNDLVRDLNLSKESAELLGSRLNEKNLLSQGTKFAFYRNRETEFSNFFEYNKEEELLFCKDITALMLKMGNAYDPKEWRLFIDASCNSLKAVLLHNGNRFRSIPVGHSVHLKESHETMKLLLKCLKFEEHQWKICGDLKVVGLILGLQGGYTKYPCFMCLWDSRADSRHFTEKNWQQRDALQPGSHNVKEKPLVDPSKILLPPLHIKLGLMKNFVKALDKNNPGFLYLQEKFPRISKEKLKAGIFDGPQIRQLMCDDLFQESLKSHELKAWGAFKAVVKNFLGNYRSRNYKNLVEELVESYQKLGARMSIKLHFLWAHLEYFPENCGDYSEEMGERFHQDLRTMEQRYQGRWYVSFLADYCWSLKRDLPTEPHQRRSSRVSFAPVER